MYFYLLSGRILDWKTWLKFTDWKEDSISVDSEILYLGTVFTLTYSI